MAEQLQAYSTGHAIKTQSREFKLARGKYDAYSAQSKCDGSQRFHCLQQNVCRLLSNKIHWEEVSTNSIDRITKATNIRRNIHEWVILPTSQKTFWPGCLLCNIKNKIQPVTLKQVYTCKVDLSKVTLVKGAKAFFVPFIWEICILSKMHIL